MNSHTERITNTERITELLLRIAQSRIGLSVHFSDHNIKYSSILLEVDKNKRIVILDELMPRDGNNFLLSNQTAHITAKLAGANIHFRSAVLNVDNDSTHTNFLMTFPERLIYEQRRAAFRVRMSSGSIVSVTIRADSQVEYQGYLFDISSSGVGVFVESSADLLVREQPYYCKIHLPGGKFVSGEFQVRFLKQDKKLHQLQVGGLFLNLSGPQRQTLDRFVMTLQRDAIKRYQE